MNNLDQYLSMLERLQIIPERDVKLICQKAREILSNQPNLVHVRAPVTVCGDTHGQFYDLLQIFQICGKLPSTNYLFMGDYVDRGFNSVQTFLYILLLKIKHKDRITILRGNHQNRQINKLYGFYDECLKKYGTDQIWKMFADLFQYLPVAAEIQNQIFCLHGGLSPEIETLDQLRTINRIQDVPHSGPLCDLLWSDPADQGKTGFSASPRGAGYCWGLDVSEKFLRKNNLKTICRAHQLVMQGYSYTHEKKCVTVFSAPNYCYRCGNQAATLEVSESLEYSYLKYDPSQKQRQSQPSRRVPEYFL